MTTNELTITLPTDDIKMLAEVMVDFALTTDSDRAELAIKLLDILKDAGIGNAAELCRDAVESLDMMN